MKFFNVHHVDQDQVESTINSHVEKGYELQGWRNAGGRRVQLIFFREFTNEQDRNSYAAEQCRKRHVRAAEKAAVKAERDALRAERTEPAA